MTDEVQWIDRGWAKFIRSVSVLDSTRIKIGVVGEASEEAAVHDSAFTVGELAHLLEYGNAHMPRRPFVNNVISPSQALQAAKRVAQAILEGRMPEAALSSEGHAFASQLRQHVMNNSDLVGDTADTVRKKGFNLPLYDTGQLMAAIGMILVHGDVAGANVEDKE